MTTLEDLSHFDGQPSDSPSRLNARCSMLNRSAEPGLPASAKASAWLAVPRRPKAAAPLRVIAQAKACALRPLSWPPVHVGSAVGKSISQRARASHRQLSLGTAAQRGSAHRF